MNHKRLESLYTSGFTEYYIWKTSNRAMTSWFLKPCKNERGGAWKIWNPYIRPYASDGEIRTDDEIAEAKRPLFKADKE